MSSEIVSVKSAVHFCPITVHYTPSASSTDILTLSIRPAFSECDPFQSRFRGGDDLTEAFCTSDSSNCHHHPHHLIKCRMETFWYRLT